MAAVSSSRPASSFVSVVPVRTTSTVPVVGVVAVESEPPVTVAPAFRTSVFAMVRPFRSSVAPLSSVMVPAPSELSLPILTMPLLMVAPAKMLAKSSSSVPEPDMIREPLPRSSPTVLMVTSPAPPMVRFAPVLVTPPVKVTSELAVIVRAAAPSPTVPLKVSAPV